MPGFPCPSLLACFVGFHAGALTVPLSILLPAVSFNKKEVHCHTSHPPLLQALICLSQWNFQGPFFQGLFLHPEGVPAKISSCYYPPQLKILGVTTHLPLALSCFYCVVTKLCNFAAFSAAFEYILGWLWWTQGPACNNGGGSRVSISNDENGDSESLWTPRAPPFCGNRAATVPVLPSCPSGRAVSQIHQPVKRHVVTLVTSETKDGKILPEPSLREMI